MLQQVRPRVTRGVVKQAYERGRDFYQKGSRYPRPGISSQHRGDVAR